MAHRAKRGFGVDACIANTNTEEFKICMFEAKWPRLRINPGYRWDYIQRNNSTSHFDDQINRQKKYASHFVIWEMFYYEFDFQNQPLYMPGEVSACALHEDAHNASNVRPSKKVAWRNDELEDLLHTGMTTIDKIVREVCACNLGEMQTGTNYVEILKDMNIVDEITIFIESSDKF